MLISNINKSGKSFFQLQQFCFSKKPIDLNYNHLQKTTVQYCEENNLIVLHGLMGNLRNFQDLLSKNQYLRSVLDIYLLDARNHGQSPWTETISYSELADDVYNFIKKKKLKNVFLMGHSMGGKTVMTILCKYPELYSQIKGSIIIDILPLNFTIGKHRDYFLKNQQIMHKLANLKLNYFKNWKDLKQEIQRVCNNDQRDTLFLSSNINVQQKDNKTHFSWKVNINVLAKDFPNLWQFQPSYEFYNNKQKYNKPFSIILGADSPFTNQPEDAKLLENIFDKTEIENSLVVLQNAGHWVHFEQKHQFLNVITQFIQSNL